MLPLGAGFAPPVERLPDAPAEAFVPWFAPPVVRLPNKPEELFVWASRTVERLRQTARQKISQTEDG